MKSYKKLIPNPLGLGVVTITKEIFTDDDIIDNISKKKLKLALKANMCEEIDVTAEASKVKKVEETKDAVIKDLEASNNSKDAVIKDLNAEVLTLKTELVSGYEDMDAKTLAKEFTVDELQFIVGTLLELEPADKEADLTKQIIEARG